MALESKLLKVSQRVHVTSKNLVMSETGQDLFKGLLGKSSK